MGLHNVIAVYRKKLSFLTFLGSRRISRAAEYLKHRNFLAGREFPPEFATSREFYPTLVTTFKAIMPLVRFLNEPLVGSHR